jgi:hypothetical protein
MDIHYLGTIALDVIREEIKVEYISLTFSNSCDENGVECKDCENDIEWKFYLGDIIGSVSTLCYCTYP